jgi:hypothetical protein
MANLALPRLRNDIALVDSDGRPTQTFQQWWDAVAKNIENSFNDLSAVVAAIAAAQASANAAQADATEAARQTARINSYTDPAASLITASDAGSNATITIANHTRIYPVQGSVAVPNVSVIGGNITALAYSTKYYIYYDDITLALTTPTFIATTMAATAQVGAANGRHFVGYVTTPASGGAATGGSGGSTPGGGGGSGAGGGQLP